MSAGLRLVLRGVRHAYGDLAVLEDIDLVAEPGEVMVLVGPSGCGKSTLLGIMGGLLAPLSGEVRCEGDVADGCLNPFTYVFQDFALLPWRTVAGNIALVLEDRLPRAERTARVAEVLHSPASLNSPGPGRGNFPAACASGLVSRALLPSGRRAC
jgi:NitT/TauT family transport system ATP-binding protein